MIRLPGDPEFVGAD